MRDLLNLHRFVAVATIAAAAFAMFHGVQL